MAGKQLGDKDFGNAVVWYELKPELILYTSFCKDAGMQVPDAEWVAEGSRQHTEIKMDCHWSHSLIERVRYHEN